MEVGGRDMSTSTSNYMQLILSQCFSRDTIWARSLESLLPIEGDCYLVIRLFKVLQTAFHLIYMRLVGFTNCDIFKDFSSFRNYA